MKLKGDVLEKIINESIVSVGKGSHESEMFAVHENSRTQVQIIITSNKNDFIDDLLTDYTDA